MARGRPLGSDIRQNVVEILYFLGRGYGYDIYKVYSAVYGKATMRSIYYNLKQGAILNEFKIYKIKSEKGNYSWGTEAEKIYYALGKEAKPKIDARVKNYLDKNKKR